MCCKRCGTVKIVLRFIVDRSGAESKRESCVRKKFRAAHLALEKISRASSFDSEEPADRRAGICDSEFTQSSRKKHGDHREGRWKIKTDSAEGLF
jgi:hypothetical protein